MGVGLLSISDFLLGRHRESCKTVLFCCFFFLAPFTKITQRREYFVMDFCEGLEIESCKMLISHFINIKDAVREHGYLSLASSVCQVIPADLLDVSKWI